jgi:hypothetical protein
MIDRPGVVIQTGGCRCPPRGAILGGVAEEDRVAQSPSATEVGAVDRPTRDAPAPAGGLTSVGTAGPPVVAVLPPIASKPPR